MSSLGKSRSHIPASARRRVGATRPGGVATGRTTTPSVRWHPLVKKMFPPARHVWNSQPVLIVRQCARGGVAVGKSLTWVVALVAAVSAILIWFPTIQRQLQWQQVEYSLLAKVHAGESSDYVTSLLGRPAIVHGFSSSPQLIEDLYLRREYTVMTLKDKAGRVVLFSVLSCGKDFAPSFSSPGGTTVTLQKVPLDRAEVPDFASQRYRTAEINDARTLVYDPGYTGSSLNQAIEIGAGSGSDAARTQSWFVGVNGACSETDALTKALITGTTTPSNPAVRRFRADHAANFYAETATDVEAAVTPLGDLYLHQYGTEDDGYTGMFVTPFSFDLPSGYIDSKGTRTF